MVKLWLWCQTSYWLPHRAAGVVDFFSVSQSQLSSAQIYVKRSVLWKIHDPPPPIQTSIHRSDQPYQHLHSTHRHNSEFDEFGSLVTRAPHLCLLTGPRLGLGSHLAPCSCCSCQLLASQIQSDIFIAYFTHSLHKTTASPWCPSAFSP